VNIRGNLIQLFVVVGFTECDTNFSMCISLERRTAAGNIFNHVKKSRLEKKNSTMYFCLPLIFLLTVKIGSPLHV